MATASLALDLPGKSYTQIVQETIDKALEKQAVAERLVQADKRSLMDVLTEQIISGNLSADDARQIVLRREARRLEEDYCRNPHSYVELDIIEKNMIVAALKSSKSAHQAAAKLGCDRNTIYRRLKKWGIRLTGPRKETPRSVQCGS